MKSRLAIFVVFMLAIFVRLYGLDWDQGQHLHPDERFLTMVASAIRYPTTFQDYLNTDVSPLNPHNAGFSFFVYGTFPLFFVKWMADIAGWGDYGRVVLVGRAFSGFFDVGTVIIVYLITRQIINQSGEDRFYELSTFAAPKTKEVDHGDSTQNWRTRVTSYPSRIYLPSLAAFFYASSVLSIQLSHFFAVDTFLTFFIAISFYFLMRIIKDCGEDRFCEPSTFAAPKTKEVDHGDSTQNWRTRATSYTSRNLQWLVRRIFLLIFLGLSFGLALSSKISAFLFLPIIAFGFLFAFLQHSRPLFRRISIFTFYLLLFTFSTYITVRLAYPYLFADNHIITIKLNPKVLENWRELKSFDNREAPFPPAVQWVTTKPYLFPLKNMVLWGLGLPLGMLAIGGLILILIIILIDLINLISKKAPNPAEQTIGWILLILWVLLLFAYQGVQFVKAMRYFHPIYPFLAILAAYVANNVYNRYKNHKYFHLLSSIFYLLIFLWPLSFLSIYTRPHSRVAASAWMYDHIPPGSNLAEEHWDDFLPVNLPDHQSNVYQGVEFPLYGPDTKEKWTDMIQKLAKVDYIILSSNRLYGSILTLPDRFPITDRYYHALFDGSLGFQKMAEFTSRPNLPLPSVRWCIRPPFARYGTVALPYEECPLTGISIVDDYADESFTVYDHPKVSIFKKVRAVDYEDVLNISALKK